MSSNLDIDDEDALLGPTSDDDHRRLDEADLLDEDELLGPGTPAGSADEAVSAYGNNLLPPSDFNPNAGIMAFSPEINVAEVSSTDEDVPLAGRSETIVGLIGEVSGSGLDLFATEVSGIDEAATNLNSSSSAADFRPPAVNSGDHLNVDLVQLDGQPVLPNVESDLITGLDTGKQIYLPSLEVANSTQLVDFLSENDDNSPPQPITEFGSRHTEIPVSVLDLDEDAPRPDTGSSSERIGSSRSEEELAKDSALLQSGFDGSGVDPSSFGMETDMAGDVGESPDTEIVGTTGDAAEISGNGSGGHDVGAKNKMDSLVPTESSGEDVAMLGREDDILDYNEDDLDEEEGDRADAGPRRSRFRSERNLSAENPEPVLDIAISSDGIDVSASTSETVDSLSRHRETASTNGAYESAAPSLPHQSVFPGIPFGSHMASPAPYYPPYVPPANVHVNPHFRSGMASGVPQHGMELGFANVPQFGQVRPLRKEIWRKQAPPVPDEWFSKVDRFLDKTKTTDSALGSYSFKIPNISSNRRTSPGPRRSSPSRRSRAERDGRHAKGDSEVEPKNAVGVERSADSSTENLMDTDNDNSEPVKAAAERDDMTEGIDAEYLEKLEEQKRLRELLNKRKELRRLQTAKSKARAVASTPDSRSASITDRITFDATGSGRLQPTPRPVPLLYQDIKPPLETLGSQRTVLAPKGSRGHLASDDSTSRGHGSSSSSNKIATGKRSALGSQVSKLSSQTTLTLGKTAFSAPPAVKPAIKSDPRILVLPQKAASGVKREDNEMDQGPVKSSSNSNPAPPIKTGTKTQEVFKRELPDGTIQYVLMKRTPKPIQSPTASTNNPPLEQRRPDPVPAGDQGNERNRLIQKIGSGSKPGAAKIGIGASVEPVSPEPMEVNLPQGGTAGYSIRPQIPYIPEEVPPPIYIPTPITSRSGGDVSPPYETAGGQRSFEHTARSKKLQTERRASYSPPENDVALPTVSHRRPRSPVNRRGPSRRSPSPPPSGPNRHRREMSPPPGGKPNRSEYKFRHISPPSLRSRRQRGGAAGDIYDDRDDYSSGSSPSPPPAVRHSSNRRFRSPTPPDFLDDYYHRRRYSRDRRHRDARANHRFVDSPSPRPRSRSISPYDDGHLDMFKQALRSQRRIAATDTRPAPHCRIELKPVSGVSGPLTMRRPLSSLGSLHGSGHSTPLQGSQSHLTPSSGGMHYNQPPPPPQSYFVPPPPLGFNNPPPFPSVSNHSSIGSLYSNPIGIQPIRPSVVPGFVPNTSINPSFQSNVPPPPGFVNVPPPTHPFLGALNVSPPKLVPPGFSASNTFGIYTASSSSSVQPPQPAPYQPPPITKSFDRKWPSVNRPIMAESIRNSSNLVGISLQNPSPVVSSSNPVSESQELPEVVPVSKPVVKEQPEDGPMVAIITNLASNTRIDKITAFLSAFETVDSVDLYVERSSATVVFKSAQEAHQFRKLFDQRMLDLSKITVVLKSPDDLE